MKEFHCKHTYSDGETEEWTGTVELIRKTASATEAQVKGRGSSLTVIVGDYTDGHFLCIPEIDVGCPMAGWGDLFWNQERLCSLMNETDAVTVAAGVKALMDSRVRAKKHNQER